MYRYMSLILGEMLGVQSTRIHIMSNTPKKIEIFCVHWPKYIFNKSNQYMETYLGINDRTGIVMNNNYQN